MLGINSLFCLSLSHVASVSSWYELDLCVQNLAEIECMLPASTVLVANSTLSFTHNVSIVGSAHSAIDLDYTCTWTQTGIFVIFGWPLRKPAF